MNTDYAMRLLRAARLLLASRGLCGQWLVAEAAVCARPARHAGPCGWQAKQAAT